MCFVHSNSSDIEYTSPPVSYPSIDTSQSPDTHSNLLTSDWKFRPLSPDRVRG